MIDKLKKWEQNGRRWLANLIWSLLGHRQYQRFVIIANERTGSSMLVSYLNAHPSVECHGEIFRFLQGDSLARRWRMYFSYKPRHLKAVGFKMLYTHPRDGNPEDLIRQILSWPSPVIIHLTRSDKLQMLASLRIAENTAIWGLHVDQDPLPVESRRVYIAPDEVRNFITNVESQEKKIEALCASHPILHLRYEELRDDPEKVLQMVFGRLGVPYHQVDTPHQKINKEPLDQLILNYEELRQTGLV